MAQAGGGSAVCCCRYRWRLSVSGGCGDVCAAHTQDPACQAAQGVKLWRQKDGASGMLRRVTYEKQVMVALSSSARVRSASASCGNCCA